MISIHIGILVRKIYFRTNQEARKHVDCLARLSSNQIEETLIVTNVLSRTQAERNSNKL